VSELRPISEAATKSLAALIPFTLKEDLSDAIGFLVGRIAPWKIEFRVEVAESV
jgi:hypothetical protein